MLPYYCRTGKQSGTSCFWNLFTSKRIIIASSLLMLALALIWYYRYHTEGETYSGDYPNSQKDAFPFTGEEFIYITLYIYNIYMYTVQVAIYPTNLNKYSASCNLSH